MKLALNSEPTLFDENLKQVRDKNAKKQSCVRLLGKPSILMSTTLGEGCFGFFVSVQPKKYHPACHLLTIRLAVSSALQADARMMVPKLRSEFIVRMHEGGRCDRCGLGRFKSLMVDTDDYFCQVVR